MLKQKAMEAQKKGWSGFQGPLKTKKDITESYKKQLLSRWGGQSAEEIDGLSSSELDKQLLTKEKRYKLSEVVKGGKLVDDQTLEKVFIKDINGDK